MKKPVISFFILLTAFILPGLVYAEPTAAILSATMLAELMQQANYSAGFEERLSVTTVNSYGHRTLPIKLAVIGQFDNKNQRLLIRGISPANIKDHFIAAEKSSDGSIRAIEYHGISKNYKKVNLFAKLFDTGLVIWDMFTPWWQWPKQRLLGIERIEERNCTIVDSLYESTISSIREVVSCVDKAAGLSLKTKLFDERHKLVRTITVIRMVGKESGTMAAKEILITDTDKLTTEIEIYSGDEHYSITPDTFPSPEAYLITGK